MNRHDPKFNGHHLSPFTHELTCLHEAAHAIVYAMGGVKVYTIEVAPVGSEKWSYEDRKGNIIRRLLGACETTKFCINDFIVIENGKLKPNIPAFIYWRKICLMILPEEGQDIYRSIRARVAGHIAGYLVEMLALNMEITPKSLWNFAISEGSFEVVLAASLCELLPYKNEFDYLVKETIIALSHEWVSKCITELADALSNHLKLSTEDIEKFTPQFQQGWPPSPRKKTPVDYHTFFYKILNSDDPFKYGHW